MVDTGSEVGENPEFVDHASVDDTSADDASAASPDMAGVSRLPLLIMGAVAAIAVLVIVVLLGTRGPVVYDPGTPEAAIQTYVNTALEGDRAALVALLAPTMAERCQQAMEQNANDYYWDQTPQDLSATLLSISTGPGVSGEGNTGTAQVEFRQGDSSDPFASSSWTFQETITLLEVDGEWMIDSAQWPYSLQGCYVPRSSVEPAQMVPPLPTPGG